MKYTPLVRILDLYKKSPDLNINQNQFKTSKISIFASLGFVCLVILANLPSIQDVWKDTKDLRIISSSVLMDEQSLTPFRVGLYFPSDCYEYQYKYFTKIHNPTTKTVHNPSQCNSQILKQFAYDEYTSCFVCFLLQDIQATGKDSIGFEIHYSNPLLETYDAAPIPGFTFIVQHKTYNPKQNYINSSYQYEIIPGLFNNPYRPQTTSVMQCDVGHIVIDDSLFDWSSPSQLSYISNCQIKQSFNKNVNASYFIFVFERVTQTVYFRQKISIILSNIISFGFLTIMLSIFITSYNNYLFKLQVSTQIIDCQENQNQLQINYFAYILLKLLKYNLLRQFFQKRYPQSKYIKLFYLQRQMNRMISVENIVIPLQQMQSEAIQQQKNQKQTKKIIFESERKQEKQATNIFINQSKTLSQQVITFDTQYHRQAPKSLLRRFIEVFDMFSSRIELEQEQSNNTSCLSVWTMLIAFLILGILIYISGISNIFYSPDIINTQMFPTTKLQIDSNVLQTYIVVIDYNTSLPVDLNFLQQVTNFTVAIYDQDRVYLRPINLFVGCIPPQDFPRNSSIVHYCINSTYTLTASLAGTEKISISFVNKLNYQLRMSYIIYHKHKKYNNGKYNYYWTSALFTPNHLSDRQIYKVFNQNIYLIKQTIQSTNIFKKTIDNTLIIQNQLDQETSQIQSKYFTQFRVNIMPHHITYHVQQPFQSYFTVIINFLGINYLLFLFIVKCLSQTFNKQKALSAMSKSLNILGAKKDECQILYDSLVHLTLAQPQSKQDIQEYNNLMDKKSKQFCLLDIVNILKTKIKLEFLHQKLVSFNYIKRKLDIEEALEEQQQQSQIDE